MVTYSNEQKIRPTYFLISKLKTLDHAITLNYLYTYFLVEGTIS